MAFRLYDGAEGGWEADLSDSPGSAQLTPAAIVARLKDEQLVQSFSQYQRDFRELDQFGGLKSPENDCQKPADLWFERHAPIDSHSDCQHRTVYLVLRTEGVSKDTG